MATTIVSGVQYSGIWTLAQVNAAISAGTWTGLPYLYSWGNNNYGQLGLGNTTNYSSPKQVGSSVSDWLSVAGGQYTFSGRKNNGTIWSCGWGVSNYGNLGHGNALNYSSPKQIGALTTWASLIVGPNITFGVTTSGALWAWGRGTLGGLGLGNVTSYSSPKQVGALTNWSIGSGGQSMAAFIKTDGTLWTWGGNFYGGLGLSNITNYSSPKQVGSGTYWTQISINDEYSMVALRTGGTLWSWGLNSSGELGLGNITNYSSPKQVGALTTWVSISAGRDSVLAVKTDGTLWSWGSNTYGRLGLGNTTNYSSPKQVGALTTWLTIAAGEYGRGMVAKKTDGTLWTWGGNDFGQLGLGDITNRSSPTQVGALTTWSLIGTSGQSVFATA